MILPFYHLFFKRCSSGARRLAWRSVALGRLWVVPESNPFLQRALRVEQRKHRPLLNVAILTLFICLLNGAAWWLWKWLYENLPQSRELKSITAPHELPRALGGNVMSGVALITLTCCVFAATFACGSRSAQNLRREVLGGTLEQLVLLPQREERWLWFLRAQPMALSLLIFLCGLPVFMLAVFTGNWSVLDIFGLLFLFVGIGHIPPAWLPLNWQARQVRGQRFDLRTWKQAMKQMQAEGKLDKSDAAPLEMQRRMARLWEQMEPVTETAPDGKKRWLVSANALSGAGNRGNNWRVFSWVFTFQLFGPLSMILRLPGNPLVMLWQNLRDALPAGVTELAPGFVLTWPLLIVRVLWAPLPFFALALPPILLYTPIWVARQVGGNLHLAAQVSPRETFWTPRRLRTRRACTRWVSSCAVFMLLGYCWKTLIDDGSLAMLMRGAPAMLMASQTATWSLATLFTLCIMIGTAIGGEILERPFKGTGEIEMAQAWRKAARLALGYFTAAIAAYLLFCLLGWQAPLNAHVSQRVLPVAATALAYLIAAYGAATLQYSLPAGQRGACKALVLFWVLGLALAALALVAAGSFYNRPFTFDQAPYVVLSPLVTLLALLRFDLNGGVPWWFGPAGQTLIGLACLLAAALKTFGAPQRKSAAEREEGDRLPAPLRWLMEALAGIWRGVTGFFEGCTELVRRADNGIVQWSRRFGNPILTDELQRRLRREHWPLGWMVLFLIAIGLLWQAWYFSWGRVEGRYVSGVALAAALLLGLISTLRLGSCYERDRANGTLVFIFLTPLSEAEITWGKLFTNAIYTGGTLLTLLPFLALGQALELAAGHAQLALAGTLSYLLIIAMAGCLSCINVLCTTWARKPSQGSFLGMLIGLLWQSLLFLPLAIFMILSGSFDNAAIYYSAGTVIFVLNCAAAFFCWKGALKLLRKQRYSDDATSGKRTG